MVAEAVLVHLVAEYGLQPESLMARKREPSLKGAGFLVLHVAVPLFVCAALGLMTPWQMAVVGVLHFVFDGPLGVGLMLITRSMSVRKVMRNPDHGQWPIQVQALAFALAAAHEKAWYAVVHVFCVYAGMKMGAML